MIEKLCGVYKITCISNKKIYIGSSLNIGKRWMYHIQDLKRDNHKNPHLQHAWNKYGAEMFEFLVIETVYNPEDLINREQYWLDTLGSYNDLIGFNICKTAESQLGHRWTDEQKKRHSTRIKEICGPSLEKANEVNRKRFLDGGVAHNAKLTKKSVVNLIDDYNKGASTSELSKKYNIGWTTAKYIIERKLWSRFTENLYIRERAKILTKEIVRDIKAKLKNGIPPKQIAMMYNINVNKVYSIKSGKTWGQVE